MTDTSSFGQSVFSTFVSTATGIPLVNLGFMINTMSTTCTCLKNPTFFWNGKKMSKSNKSESTK